MNAIAVDNSRAGNPSSILLAPPLPFNANAPDRAESATRVFNWHGEVEKGPHRQYGIYSIHVHHLISSPLPDDNDDVLDPLLSPPSDYNSPSCSSNSNDCHVYQSAHDQPPLSDHAFPPCSSNINDCHAYPSPHDRSLPSNPSDSLSISLQPIPSALSFGESFEGQGAGSIGASDCSGDSFRPSESYTGTPQTTHEPKHTILAGFCFAGTDDVANGVSASGDLKK